MLQLFRREFLATLKVYGHKIGQSTSAKNVVEIVTQGCTKFVNNFVFLSLFARTFSQIFHFFIIFLFSPFLTLYDQKQVKQQPI